MATKLTEKQKMFVQEYLIDLNATQAAIRAGYSARTAHAIGSELLEKTLVAEAVARAKAERSARVGLTQDRVIAELAAIAFARMPHYVEWGTGDQMALKHSAELTDEQAAAVAQVTESEKFIKTLGKSADDEPEQLMSRERSIKLHDKVPVLKLLGQHLGLFTDKHEVTVEVRERAEQIAEELGVPVDQVLREAGIGAG